jgi:hypothetical protein
MTGASPSPHPAPRGANRAALPLLTLVVVVGAIAAIRATPAGPRRPPHSSPTTAAPPPATPRALVLNTSPDPLLPPIETVFNLDGLAVPRREVLRGVWPKDAIPALVNPATVPVAEAALDNRPTDRVVGLTINGESRAYPINLIYHHELINDRLGGMDVAVLYCSVCDSVKVVDRRLGGKTYTFGISCMTYQSNMLFYDQTDQALWSQMTSEAISGPNVGRALRDLGGWEVTTFGAWRDAHPGSTVISFKTGYNFDYHIEHNIAYFAKGELDRRFQDLPVDGRLKIKDRVIGVAYAGKARAYPLDRLKGVGRAGVRDRLGDGRVEFAVDAKTGAVRVVRVPETAVVIHTFWFAWSARFPKTEIASPGREADGEAPR